MTTSSDHRCRVLGSPWAGVYSTYIRSSRHYGKHWHSTFGLGLLVQGAQSSASGRGNVDAYAGDLIATNPGEVHDGRPLGGDSRHWRMVYIDPDVMELMNGEQELIVSGVEIMRPVFRDAKLRRSLQRLLGRIETWSGQSRSSPADVLACEESLVQTTALLLARHGTQSPRCESAGDVNRARDRLADSLLDPPSLGELAATVGLSKYQLIRQFKRTYRLPPYTWLMVQRAELARNLIQKGSGLAEAAASCGFADQSHMTRIFARHFGFTPGTWLKATGRANPVLYRHQSKTRS